MNDNEAFTIAVLLLAFERVAIAVCITYAAVYFDNPKLLWWYVVILLMSGKVSSKRKECNDG